MVAFFESDSSLIDVLFVTDPVFDAGIDVA